MDIITNNPFRVLGICSNATAKEVNADKGMLNVGEIINYPTDFLGILPLFKRDSNVIEQAVAQINLPQDKIKYALFWFMKLSSVDEIAINYLQIGDKAKALDCWSRQNDVSSLMNKGVLSFVMNNYDDAICCISQVIHDKRNRALFLQSIIDETFSISEAGLARLFIDTLYSEMPEEDWYIRFLELDMNGDDCNYILNRLFQKYNNEIDICIAQVPTLEDDSEMAYDAGIKLINTSKPILEEAKKFMGDSCLEYETITDKLVEKIFACSISCCEFSYENALELLKYAKTIAVKPQIKETIRKSIICIEFEIEIAPIKEDVYCITEKITQFENTKNTISTVKDLVNSCLPRLQNIKLIKGVKYDKYIGYSNIIASKAIKGLEEIIDNEKTFFANNKSDAQDVLRLFNQIGELDMLPVIKDRYNLSQSKLKSIEPKKYSPPLSPPESWFEKNPGCTIFIIVVVVIIIISILSD